MLEFVAVFFFLLTAMAFVYTLGQLRIFKYISQKLLTKNNNGNVVSRNLTMRQYFRKNAIAAGILSPIFDNLTTGLMLQQTLKTSLPKVPVKVLVAFYVIIIVAANSTGAVLPSGDPTTLLAFLQNHVSIGGLLLLIPACLIAIIVPYMKLVKEIPNDIVEVPNELLQPIKVHKYGWYVLMNFIAVVVTTILFHIFFHIPAGFTMLAFGIGSLGIWSYFISKYDAHEKGVGHDFKSLEENNIFNFKQIFSKGLEYDTLLFFGGIIMMVAAIAVIGILAISYAISYGVFGNNVGNWIMGLLSALIDNIPIMVMIIGMKPKFSGTDWLMAVFTTGTGGSALSTGSAIGVGMMGDERYTFGRHAKHSIIILIGYTLAVIYLWAFFTYILPLF